MTWQNILLFSVTCLAMSSFYTLSRKSTISRLFTQNKMRV